MLAAPIYPADQPDSATLLESVVTAQVNLMEAQSGLPAHELAQQPQAATAELMCLAEAMADKNYHKAETLAACTARGVRTYIGEPRRRYQRVWIGKPAAWQRAYRNNRRRVKGRRSKRLQRLRSEKVERTFAHLCETGGGRRSWLRGLLEVGKRYLLQVAAHNLGVVMRRMFGRGTPRSLQGSAAAGGAWLCSWPRTVWQQVALWCLVGQCKGTKMLAISKECDALQLTE